MMIRHIGTFRENQARYARNSNKRSQDYFIPDQLHQPQYDHLVPPMKRALKFTARATWFMMKTLVKTAFLLPRLFSKTATLPKAQPKKKNPSPLTAFPAP